MPVSSVPYKTVNVSHPFPPTTVSHPSFGCDIFTIKWPPAVKTHTDKKFFGKCTKRKAKQQSNLGPVVKIQRNMRINDTILD